MTALEPARGLWEAGPPTDKPCESCGGPIDPLKAQFLGLSNGDWAWYCNLTCLIEGANQEHYLQSRICQWCEKVHYR
jgi:hypothetical protein